MYIQPVGNQPNFSGKLVINVGAQKHFAKEKLLDSKFKQIADLMQDKSYDMFIYKDKQNPDFYCVAANKNEKMAREIKEYTVRVQSDIMVASIIDAAKDAIEMYEKYISKSIKG